MKKLLIAILCIAINSCTEKKEPPYQFSTDIHKTKVPVYSTDWRSVQNDELVKLGQTLSAYKITGCGTMYIKNDEECYLVACYSDLNKRWSYYEIEFNDGIGNLSQPKSTSKEFITEPKI